MQSEVGTLERGRDRDPPDPHLPPPPRTRRQAQTLPGRRGPGQGPSSEARKGQVFSLGILPISDLAEAGGELGSLAVCTASEDQQLLPEVQLGVCTK